MHFEFLIEDASGKAMLDIIIPKIIDESHTFYVHAYNGIGRIPKKEPSAYMARHQALLNDLPRILKGYGRTHQSYGGTYDACVVVVCDLDDRCLKQFRADLLNILQQCSPAPRTQFCIAVEEVEAWLLGDISAVITAYPKAIKNILSNYTNDSICGTWEVLQSALRESNPRKKEWAEKNSPHIHVQQNKSASFQYFVKKVRELTQPPTHASSKHP